MHIKKFCLKSIIKEKCSNQGTHTHLRWFYMILSGIVYRWAIKALRNVNSEVGNLGQTCT